MPRDVLAAAAGRAWMGGLLRSGVAIVFPSVALLEDRQAALGILLYLVEIILTALMLVGRAGVASAVVSRAARAGVAGEEDVRSTRKARELAMTGLAVALLGLPFLIVAVLLAHPEMDWPALRHAVVDRGQWLALLILASAALDTLVAPVRTPEWLQASVAMHVKRTILLHPVILFGFLLFGLTGTLSGMVVLFVVGRLLMDGSAMFGAVDAWRPRHWQREAERPD